MVIFWCKIMLFHDKSFSVAFQINIFRRKISVCFIGGNISYLVDDSAFWGEKS